MGYSPPPDPRRYVKHYDSNVAVRRDHIVLSEKTDHSDEPPGQRQKSGGGKWAKYTFTGEIS